MTTVTVTTPQQLDKALADKVSDIIINSPAGAWLRISDSGSASVRAYGSASVKAYGSASVEAYGSASVKAFDSASVEASGSASVRASDSATVRASGSATVEAYGSATVKAYGSASVVAYGSATVKAYGSATVKAGKYVAIHLHSQRVTLTGGVVIDMTAVNPQNVTDWIDLAGATVTDGKIRVFKAVNDTLESAQQFAYPIGGHVTDSKWRDDHECGGGLHFSPSPAQARDHFRTATRFLACDVLLSEVRCIDPTKLKAPQSWVISEVDIHGRELVAK